MITERRSRKAATVLVPLEGTPQSHRALPVATEIARLGGAALHIAYVAEHAVQVDELVARLSLSDEELAGAVIDEVEGLPAEGIVRIAEEQQSALIVMAMHRGEPDSESGLGPVAMQVVGAAPCPVLIVPPEKVGERWSLRAVLLPQDGSPGAAAAVAPIAHLAHRGRAQMLVVHVSGPGAVPPTEPGSLVVPQYLDQPQHEWPAWVSEFIDRVRGLTHLPADLDLRFFLARGDPGVEIVRIAEREQVSLVVLTWHESLEPEHAGTIKGIMRRSPCPVLVLPSTRTLRLQALERP